MGKRQYEYMKKEVCVIIPVYKEKLSAKEEKATLNNCICLKEVQKFFIVPDNLDCTYYTQVFPKVALVRFPTKYFKSINTYSRLMLSIRFYKKFEEYRYVLICQTDVWLLKNTGTLKKFTKLGYDYIGAPWFPKTRIQFPSQKISNWHFKEYELSVGNGGLSLRNVNKTIYILKRYFWLKCLWGENEDLFFSFIGEMIDKNYRIPSVKIAEKFSLETRSKDMIIKEGIIPFGVHAYQKYFRELPRQTKEIKKG